MKIARLASALIPVLALACLALSCGSNSVSNSGTNRQLQSITITQTASGQQFEFVATGNFSSSPTTVTPIPVLWSVQLLAPPPPQ